MPVGDIREILYFNQDLVIDNGSFRIQAIGSLSLSNQNELNLIAKEIIAI